MLVKTYEVCGKKLKLKCSALTPKLYRREFNRDLLRDFNTITQNIAKGPESELGDVITDIVYIMAVQAGYEGDQEEFLDQFNNPAFAYLVVPHMFDLWNECMAMTAVPAKKKGTRQGKITDQHSS